MTTFWSTEPEFHEIYEEFSSGRARVRSLNELRDLIEDSVYWVEGRIVDVVDTKQFCFLSCRICGKPIEVVGGMKWCFQCGEYTFRDIFRYNVEVIVADDTGSSTFVLRNKACEKLIGEPAADVIAQYGDTARTMPQSIKENFLGQKGLFEVVVSSLQTHLQFFSVSRLTVDKEIKELYIKNNIPDYESSSDEDSFLKTLDYVEEQDRAAEGNVHTAEESDEAAEESVEAAEESVEAAGSADEIEPDAKRQKKDMNEDK
ncbi:procollagen-proline 4-dioxygenase [Castilleja foliolosa]|uniref:Procollagen-proline 4-dioxygenase n=1 Tax=Castilleja foliolosa TaxID=1961234 RepID=A0ABD3DF05_9LAMI